MRPPFSMLFHEVLLDGGEGRWPKTYMRSLPWPWVASDSLVLEPRRWWNSAMMMVKWLVNPLGHGNEGESALGDLRWKIKWNEGLRKRVICECPCENSLAKIFIILIFLCWNGVSAQGKYMALIHFNSLWCIFSTYWSSFPAWGARSGACIDGYRGIYANL